MSVAMATSANSSISPTQQEEKRGFLPEFVDEKEENNNTIPDQISSKPFTVTKEISVDPISVLESVPTTKTAAEGDIASVYEQNASNSKLVLNYPPLLLPIRTSSKTNNKLQLLGSSLPSSAASSPKSGPPPLAECNKTWRNQCPPNLRHSISSLARQRSSIVSPLTIQSTNLTNNSNLARSKSCGDGRASSPTDKLDIYSNTVLSGGKSKNRNKVHVEDGRTISDEANDPKQKSREMVNTYNDNFKCGVLCLYLPGFRKGKRIRQGKKEGQEQEEIMATRNVISRTVSLEQFECGSWSTPGIITSAGNHHVGSARYYDLPLELIQPSGDTDTPVASAFVFEREIKGVLKNSASRRDQTRNSCESSTTPRHVRFSISNPPASCITPRLRKAREEFNAFLEAQGA